MCLAIVILTIILVSLPHIKDAKTGHTIKPNNTCQPVCFDSFSIPEYFDRIEKEHIKLLQEREQNPVSKVIELWWGMDGIRLLEDGTTEWVRKDATQILREKTAPRDLECESQYRELYKMANANNIMIRHATDILDTHREVDIQNLSYESLFHGQIELQEAIDIFEKIRYLDKRREAEKLRVKYLNRLQTMRWISKINPLDFDSNSVMCGMNGIENANIYIQRVLDTQTVRLANGNIALQKIKHPTVEFQNSTVGCKK